MWFDVLWSTASFNYDCQVGFRQFLNNTEAYAGRLPMGWLVWKRVISNMVWPKFLVHILKRHLPLFYRLRENTTSPFLQKAYEKFAHHRFSKRYDVSSWDQVGLLLFDTRAPDILCYIFCQCHYFSLNLEYSLWDLIKSVQTYNCYCQV